MCGVVDVVAVAAAIVVAVVVTAYSPTTRAFSNSLSNRRWRGRRLRNAEHRVKCYFVKTFMRDTIPIFTINHLFHKISAASTTRCSIAQCVTNTALIREDLSELGRCRRT